MAGPWGWVDEKGGIVFRRRSRPGLSRPRVVMQQAWLPHYRVPFFEGVRSALAEAHIDFELVHGLPYGEDAAKSAAARLPWATVVPNHVIRVMGAQVVWQPVVGRARGADLVICEQATSQLAVYPLLVQAAMMGQRFALWGHGRNFQTGRSSATGERVKRWITRRADWWFAYNRVSVRALTDLGIPVERITNFQNAIDTAGLQRDLASIRQSERDEWQRRLGIDDRSVVAIYVGGLYAEKRLDFLVRAADRIHGRLDDFRLLVVGDGPEAAWFRSIAQDRPWLHMLGAKFGREKAALLGFARLQLMPGLVGLAVLDSFAVGVPLVTVADSEHSPEIAYLDEGVNGAVLPAGTDPDGYAVAVIELLLDDGRLEALVGGCQEARARYTVEAMVQRFAGGVVQALRAPVGRRMPFGTREAA